MDLRRLEVFAKVAELGSFSRAAEALFLTQPTISEHVRALEEEVGLSLLDRMGRGATPTPAGQLLLGYARRILTLSRETKQAVEQFQGRMSGQLTVGGSTIPGEYVLPMLVGQFKARFPDISISLLVGSSRQINDWVEEGGVEIGVAGARPASRMLQARELMPDELVIVVPAEHAWANTKSVMLANLKTQPLIVRERGSGSREAVERALADVGGDLAAFRVVAEMGSTQAVKQAVRAGVGIALISKRAVVDECRARLLHCVKVTDLTISRSFYLVTHRDRPRSPLAHAFVDFLAPVVDDPYTWGAVAAANAMSDVYAMGGQVMFALAVAGFPRELPKAIIAEVFRGGAEKVAEAGGVIAGGHTVIDAEPKYGLCVTGRVHPDRILIKGGLRPGDRLFLSKPLGTGVITTAAKDGKASVDVVEGAVQSMLRLNRVAAEVAADCDVRGATDITGFGLLGHAGEMVEASGAGIAIAASRLPLLPGALALAEAGNFSGGMKRNRRYVEAVFGSRLALAADIAPALTGLLFESETSGGLLFSVAPDRASRVTEGFARRGEPCWEVGEVVPQPVIRVSR